MRLCHSVWVKPMQTERWGVTDQAKSNLWYFALSAHYAKKVGAEIVLHTDELGEKLFGFIPYNNIYRTLDKLEVDPKFWAAGKIFAQEAEPIGSVHIDGDVFIKTDKALDAINCWGYDMVTQNKESCDGFCYGSGMHAILPLIEKSPPKGFDTNNHEAYNCGVVAFGNAQLKKTYIDGYYYMLDKICQQEAYKEKKDAWEVDFCPDLIIEQWWLKKASDYHNSRVKFVFEDTNCMQERAVSIGYTHVIGKSKYVLVDIVKERLRAENPKLWELTNKQYQSL